MCSVNVNLHLLFIIVRLALSPIAVLQQGNQGARTLWAAVSPQTVIQGGRLQGGGTAGRQCVAISFRG
jgi:hypothetical protein